MTCFYHLCNNELTGRQTKYCSYACKLKDATTKNRRSRKERIIEYMGGKCAICGYNKSRRALSVHHKDPTQKDFVLSGRNYSKPWPQVQEELDKCVLLCMNCHMEVHDNLVALGGFEPPTSAL